jgi:hypothetical protein
VDSKIAYGDWSIGSDHNKLKGYVIAAVGSVSTKSFLTNLYEFKESYFTTFCFVSLGYLSVINDQPALVILDTKQNIRLAIIEAFIGNIKISIEEIKIVECSDPD